MSVPIEDEYQDVLQKAAVGLRLGHAALALTSGLNLKEVRALIDGEFSETHARKLAPLLGLDAHKLVALAKRAWCPEEVFLPGLHQCNMPFPEAGYPGASVNSYLVYNTDTREAIAFDTGTSAEPILECIRAQDLLLKAVFLTHTHRDHVGGFEKLVAFAQTGRAFTPADEPFKGASSLQPDSKRQLCGFDIHAVKTNGHSKGALSYIVHGLDRPIALVGDALFSLSMGGAKRAYQLALKNNRELLFSLPSETILCPGHGPMSSVVEERAHNPFF
jgi:glyoxylase-like metal-dependent hydrolase (beta-lactamase superfamily II)